MKKTSPFLLGKDGKLYLNPEFDPVLVKALDEAPLPDDHPEVLRITEHVEALERRSKRTN